MSMKKSNDTIGNRTRDLPAAVPQPTALPRAPYIAIYVYIFLYFCLVQVKLFPYARSKGVWESGSTTPLILSSGARWDEWSTAFSSHFTHGEFTVPTEQEASWAPELVRVLCSWCPLNRRLLGCQNWSACSAHGAHWTGGFLGARTGPGALLVFHPKQFPCL